MIFLTQTHRVRFSQARFKSVKPVFAYEPESCFYSTVKEQNGLISKHHQLWKFAFLFWHLIAGQEKHTHPLKCAPFLLHKRTKTKLKEQYSPHHWSFPQCLTTSSTTSLTTVRWYFTSILQAEKKRRLVPWEVMCMIDNFFSFTELRHVLLR